MADETLSALRTLIKLQKTTVLLQRFALLGPERIVHFRHLGQEVALHLPDGDRDLVQGHIVQSAGFYEQRLLSTVLEAGVVAEGGTIIDVGANIGNHSVFFGHFLKPKKLYAFEPQDQVHAVLEKNLGLNGLSKKAEVIKSAVGDTLGQSRMSRSKSENLGAASFAQADDGEFPLTTLDAVVPKASHGQVSFVKIDVEGNEAAVLRGARGILAKSRPPLWVETLPGAKDGIDRDLAEFGYVPQTLNRSNHLYLPPAT